MHHDSHPLKGIVHLEMNINNIIFSPSCHSKKKSILLCNIKYILRNVAVFFVHTIDYLVINSLQKKKKVSYHISMHL